MKENIIELRIEDMLDDGRAFGRADGMAIFVSGGCEADDKRVSGAVEGDLVRAEIVKVKKSFAEARLVEILEPSPERDEAKCPYFGECGGCTLQELSYEAQLRLKTEQVRAKLMRLGGLDSPIVNDCIGAENPKFYRNKAVFAVGPHGEVGFKKSKSNYVIDIEDCLLQSDAAVKCADALRSFLKLPSSKGLAARVIKQMTVRTAFGTGEVMVVLETDEDNSGRQKNRKANKKSGKVPEINDIETLASMLDDAVYSLNTKENETDADVILSEQSESKDLTSFDNSIVWSLESVALIHNGKCHIIAGKPTITETFTIPESYKSDVSASSEERKVSYEISPQSFFQVNPEQMLKLYDKVAEYADLSNNERGQKDSSSTLFSQNDTIRHPERSAAELKDFTVLDLYCGAGTIGIWLLAKLRAENEEAFNRTKVIGIESVKPTVIDANRNSVINGITNTRYFCGKAEEELPGMMGLAKLYKWNEVNERVEREPEIRIGRAGLNADFENAVFAEKIDVAILDPPRAGCDEALLSAVAAAQPDRIVYVSCDPGTLARDVKYLRDKGYTFIEATPIDQFAFTSHCEVTTLLKRL